MTSAAKPALSRVAVLRDALRRAEESYALWCSACRRGCAENPLETRDRLREARFAMTHAIHALRSDLIDAEAMEHERRELENTARPGAGDREEKYHRA